MQRYRPERIGDFILSTLAMPDGKIQFGVATAHDEYGNLEEPHGARHLASFYSREEAINFIRNQRER